MQWSLPDDTLTASITTRKTQSNLITSQLSMTDEFKGETIAPLTASTYASWSVEMEALERTEGLWKCTQFLTQDFMTTLGTLTLKEKDEIETKFDNALGTIQCFPGQHCSRKPYCQRCLEDTQGSVGRATILYQDLFTDPSLHNQARRRIS